MNGTPQLNPNFQPVENVALLSIGTALQVHHFHGPFLCRHNDYNVKFPCGTSYWGRYHGTTNSIFTLLDLGSVLKNSVPGKFSDDSHFMGVV